MGRRARAWRKTAQHYDRHRHVVWAHTTLNKVGAEPGARAANAIVDWGMGVSAEFGQFWGEVLRQRAGRPNCPSEPPAWVQSVTFANDAREPLFSCGMQDPANGKELEVRLVNNRSYGMWISFSGGSPDWTWLNSPGMFYSDLAHMLATKGGIISAHGNDIYLPPTTEAHLGFHDASPSGFQITAQPATELVVASGAISILTSRLIGLRNKLMLTPLFACSANASTLVQNQSLKSIAAAIISCARKSIDAIAAHKMAFLDNATQAWLGIKSKALAEIVTAMAVTDIAFMTADVLEIVLGTSGRAVAVKHAFVRPVAPPTQTPQTPQTPTPQTQPPQNPPPPATYSETAGGLAHTWTNYTNAGGTEGPTIAALQTVQIACALTGFRVADGNTWWYRIASSPWNGQFYVSADAFYNNGRTSGSLVGTPFVDPNVRAC